MNVLILQPASASQIETFINFWDQFYNEEYKTDYFDIITKASWDIGDIDRLFKWKNNMGKKEKKLGKTKRVYVEKVEANLAWINANRQSVSYPAFVKQFRKFGPIWSLTLLHAMKPLIYPIYDQHVHRAYCFLSSIELSELKAKEAYEKYQTDYLPFFQCFTKRIPKSLEQMKKVDNALWAFGKFLKLYSRMFNP